MNELTKRWRSPWQWSRWMQAGMVLLLVSAYPLSFGPACWLMSWTDGHDAPMRVRNAIESSDVVSATYNPLVMAWMWGPVPIRGAIAQYANLFATGDVSVYQTGNQYRVIVNPKRRPLSAEEVASPSPAF